MRRNAPRTRRGILTGVAGGGVATLAAHAATARTDPLTVAISETNDPVASGDVLRVAAEIENNGTEPVSTDAVLVVGHDPQQVDSTTVSVGAGETEPVTLEFETADVANDQEFPVRVETDADADERSVLVTADGPAVEIDIARTNDPLATGETLEVTTHVRTVGDRSATEEIALVVGHDPQQVDSATVSLTGSGARVVTLAFETADVARTQEFPVRVVGSTDQDERTVRVIGSDDDPVERDVTFPSCSRAEVSGTFGEGDSIAASTGFYDEVNGEPLYGNTRIEDWIEVGEHVDAPFSGTVVFEIGDERSVSETGHGARVTVPDYGDLGTVLTGITMPEDYLTAGITDTNPEAGSCLAEIEDGAGDDNSDAAVTVSITGTNDPVQAGEFLEVTAVLENAGDAGATPTATLVVGHDPQTVDSTTVSIAGGATETVTLGYETYPAARTTTFPVRVETAAGADRRTVEVIGTEEGSTETETETETDADDDTGAESLEQEADADGDAADTDGDTDDIETDTDTGGETETDADDGSDEPASGPEPAPGDDTNDTDTDTENGATDESGETDDGTADADSDADGGDDDMTADTDEDAAVADEDDDNADANGEGPTGSLLGFGR